MKDDDFILNDSAFTIAFSIRYRGKEPTKGQFFVSLLRRLEDLVDDEWRENLDYYDTYEVSDDEDGAAPTEDDAQSLRTALNRAARAIETITVEEQTTTPSPEELAILEATENMRPEVTHRRLWEAGFRGWSWQRIMEWQQSRGDTEEVTDA